jgi:hypothetical protein
MEAIVADSRYVIPSLRRMLASSDTALTLPPLVFHVQFIKARLCVDDWTKVIFPA